MLFSQYLPKKSNKILTLFQASKLSGLVGSHVDQQQNFCSKLNVNLADNLERRSEEKGLVTNTYTEAVTKLIEVFVCLFQKGLSQHKTY